MNPKPQFLIIENRQDWHQILISVLPKDPIEIQTVPTYQSALKLIEADRVALVLIDLAAAIAAPDTEDTHTNPPSLGNLLRLVKLGLLHPDTRFVIESGNYGLDHLRNMPSIPDNMILVEKISAENQALRAFVDQAAAGDLWAPPEVKIERPTSKINVVSNSTISTAMHDKTDTSEQHSIIASATTTEVISDNNPHSSSLGMTAPLRDSLPANLTPPGVGSRPGRSRVLIVEDQGNWQDTLAQLMEEEGYFWRIALTHDQALERLRLESFHLVLLDLMIGGTSGTAFQNGPSWKLLDYLVTSCPKTKIIVISGQTSSTDVAKLFMGYPIKGYIDKRAFNPNELRTIVREQIAGPVLRIRMLGDFRILRDGKLINDFGQDLVETVIKILLTRRGESISVNELIDYLWPESDPKENYTNLGMIIGSARAVLEPDLPRSNDSKFIIRNGANYQFNIMNIEIDSEQLRQLISEARQHERQGELDQAINDYNTARELYRGDYLPSDRSMRWAMQERVALQGLYTAALNRMADLYAELGNLDMAIEVASQAMQVDAYIESTYRRLMRFHACKHSKNAALAVYRALTKLFREFFDEEPAQATIELFEAIDADQPVNCVEEPTSQRTTTTGNITSGD